MSILIYVLLGLVAHVIFFKYESIKSVMSAILEIHNLIICESLFF